MRHLLILPILLIATAAGAQDRPSVWDLVEELRIGSVDGPHAMTRVTDVTTSPDGQHLFAVESVDRSIWMFDAESGDFLRKIGRGGDGPGEFRSPSKLGWHADTLYVTDWQLPRLNFYTTAGEHLRTIALRSPVLPQTGRTINPIGYTSQGHVLGAPSLTAGHVQSGELLEIPWYLLDPAGAIVRTIGMRRLRGAGARVSFGTAESPLQSFIPLPMAERDMLGMQPNGESLILLSQPASSDEPGRFRLTRLAASGDTIYSRTYTYRPQPVTEEIRDQIRSEFLTTYARLAPPDRLRSIADEHLSIPAFHPPFTALRTWITVAKDGSAWLRREELGGATVDWLVVAPDGSVAGRVIAPSGLRILHVAGGKVWGLVAGEFNIPYIVRYRTVERAP